jgi:hypothetical protein
MPIRVGDLVQERRKIRIKLSAGELEVTYRPNELTPAKEQLFTEALNNRDKTHRIPMLDMFHDLVVDWDLEGPLTAAVQVVDDETNEVLVQEGQEVVADGERVGTHPDHTMHLPSHFIARVFTAIQKDMNPDPKESKGNSGGGSFRRVK